MISINIFLVLFGLTLIENVAAQTAKCTGPGWTVYKDTQKCIKLIEKRVIRKEALTICKQEESNIAQSNSATSSHPPQLLTIDSQTQQDFLNEYLFTKNKLKSNVWIGAKRFTPNMGADYFIWENGSKVDFSSWAQNYPTSVSERPCVAMAIDAGGNWKDFICDMEYFVVCQRDMHDNEKPWSLEKLTEEFLETRKKLTDALDKENKQFGELQKKFDDEKANSEKQFNNLKKDIENVKVNSEKQFKKLETKVDEEKANSEKQFKILETKVDEEKVNSEKQFKKLETKVDEEKANSEKQFKKLETKVDNEKTDLENKFKKLETKVDDENTKLESQFKKLETKVDNEKTDLESKFKKLETKVDDEKTNSEKQFGKLKMDVGDIRTNITNEIQLADTYFRQLEDEVLDTRTNLTIEVKRTNDNFRLLNQDVVDTQTNFTIEVNRANNKIKLLVEKVVDTRTNLTNEVKLANDHIQTLEKEVGNTRTNLTKLDNELKIANEKIDQLVANSTGIPIGFIYTQLQNEKTPYELFGPGMNWTDVSADYAGLFFRVNGNGSEEFGKIQEENSPRMVKFISGLEQDMPTVYAGAGRNVSIASDGWSGAFLTGYISDSQDEFQPAFINFKHQGGEVRPRNMAICVWKRTV